MRIALRTSGGRGEYELAGQHDNIKSATLFDKEIIIELSPGLRISTGNIVRLKSGKRRIRRLHPESKHLYQLLAAILLLPKPKRELGETGSGHVQLVDDHFSLADTWFDVVAVTPETVVIRPTYIRLANSESSKTLDVTQRMNLVINLWNKVDGEAPSSGQTLLQTQQAAYYGAEPLALMQAAAAIRHTITGDEDPLRQLNRDHHLSDSTTTDMGITSVSGLELPDINPKTIIQSTQEIARKWRQIAYRGAEGDRFRREVTKAYGSTCLFSGHCLPNTPLTGSSGVDAAHILPWAAHNINTVPNGICLDKLCHWAFDAGVLRLDFDDSTNDYLLSVPENIKRQQSFLDLTPFLALEGPIPKDRLPHDHNKWPNPAFIAQYNTAVPLV